jgi:hypothetical protein
MARATRIYVIRTVPDFHGAYDVIGTFTVKYSAIAAGELLSHFREEYELVSYPNGKLSPAKEKVIPWPE